MRNGQRNLFDDVHWNVLGDLRVRGRCVVMLMKVTASATTAAATAISAIVSFPAVLRAVAKGQSADNKLIEENCISQVSMSMPTDLLVTTCFWPIVLVP